MSKKPNERKPRQRSSRPPQTGFRAWVKKRWKPLVGILATAVTASLAGLITTAINSGTSAIEQLGNGSNIPFTWVVATDNSSCARLRGGLVVASLPTQVADTYNGLPPPGAGWAPLDADYTDVTLTLQGKTDTAVILDGMQISVIKRLPARGVVVEPYPLRTCNSGCPLCQSIQSVRAYTADIDLAHPVAVPADQANHFAEINDAAQFPFKISNSDPEVLSLLAATHNCDCEWSIKLDWSSGSGHGIVTIDDQGELFRTIGAASLKHYHPSEDGWDLDERPTS